MNLFKYLRSLTVNDVSQGAKIDAEEDKASTSLPEKAEIPLLFPIGHFYSPIADPVDLKLREDKIYAQSDSMQAINLNVDGQLLLLKQLKTFSGQAKWPTDRPDDPSKYFYSNDQFPVLDAEFLYCALRHFRPKAMIEVGSGFSSLITAEVNRDYFNLELNFTCIEPYPRQFLLDGVQGISSLIQEKIEDVDLSIFDQLHSGDILFIDSSHVSKIASDVNFLFFEVIPRLRPGVIVHIHDIFLPDEYPRVWMIDQGRNWNEQYLTRAFLMFNKEWSVIWASHFMGTRYTKDVQMVFPQYPKLGGGGSIWLRRNS